MGRQMHLVVVTEGHQASSFVHADFIFVPPAPHYCIARHVRMPSFGAADLFFLHPTLDSMAVSSFDRQSLPGNQDQLGFG